MTKATAPQPAQALSLPIYLDYQTFNENHNAQERLFSDFARENDIEFLNLTPALWQMTIEQGEMYNYADPHWNQAGNQLAADLIQNYLQTAEEGGSGN